MKEIHTKLNRINRYLYLDRVGKGDSQEARTLRGRLHHYEDYTVAAENLRAKLEECRKRVDKERRDRWLEWSKECWGTRKRAIYRWASGKSSVRSEQKMHAGDVGPDITDRMEKAIEVWSTIWNTEGAGAYVPNFNGILPTITGERLRAVLNRMPDGKSKGYDSWAPNELRALTDAHL